MTCSMNCFSCEFSDCINDNDDLSEFSDLDKQIDDEAKKNAPESHRNAFTRWYWRNYKSQRDRNHENYLLNKSNEEHRGKVREANRRYKARLRAVNQ